MNMITNEEILKKIEYLKPLEAYLLGRTDGIERAIKFKKELREDKQ